LKHLNGIYYLKICAKKELRKTKRKYLGTLFSLYFTSDLNFKILPCHKRRLWFILGLDSYPISSEFISEELIKLCVSQLIVRKCKLIYKVLPAIAFFSQCYFLKFLLVMTEWPLAHVANLESSHLLHILCDKTWKLCVPT